jgi:hypothetical protein
MKRDWVWGVIVIVPAFLLSGYALAWIGLPPGGEWIGTALLFVLVAALCTGAMWLKNRHSIRKIRRAGGEIALMIRPLDAAVHTARDFPLYIGMYIFWCGLIGQPLDMREALILCAMLAFFGGLRRTSYTPPMTWT